MPSARPVTCAIAQAQSHGRPRDPPSQVSPGAPREAWAARGLRGRVRWDRVGRVSLLGRSCVVAGLYVQQGAGLPRGAQPGQPPARDRAAAHAVEREPARAAALAERPGDDPPRRARAGDGAGRRASVRGDGAAEALTPSRMLVAGQEPDAVSIGADSQAMVVLRFDDVIGLWREGAAPARPTPTRATQAGARAGDRRDRGRAAPAGRRHVHDRGARALLRRARNRLVLRHRRPSVAPGNPEAWDLTTVAGAAFARYVREASDYAGGARIVRED